MQDVFLQLPSRNGTLFIDLAISDVSRIVPAESGGSLLIFQDGSREHTTLSPAETAKLVDEYREKEGLYDGQD